MSFITRAYGTAKLALKSKAPTLMVTTGVISMGVSVVLASRQTLKVESVLSEHVDDLEKIHRGEGLGLQSYGQEVAREDRFRVYSRVSFDLAKLYFVPAVAFTGGAALVFGGHRLLLKRNATLALAFTGLKKSFDSYRARVAETFGEDVDQGMLSGHKVVEVVDSETGEKKTVNTRDWGQVGNDLYNRVFEQGSSSEWQPDLGTNKMFVAYQREHAQHLLNRQGYLYLSDVYKSLGFPENDISRVVGWKIRRNPDGSREVPMVDFGLDKPIPDDWKYNREKAIYLDFNCQGLIVGGSVQKALEKA